VKLSVRVFLGFFLIVALAAYFVLAIFMREVKPGVRQGMEVALVDAANLLAELAAPELEAGHLGEGPFAEALQRYQERQPKVRIWGLPKEGMDFRVYVTDAKGLLLFDSDGEQPGADYSRWNDVLLTLRGQYGVRSTHRDPKDPSSSVMYVAAPILVQGRIAGVLSVGTSTASVVPFAQRSERRVYHAGLVLMGAALLMGIGLTLWLTRSLRRLQVYAGRVAEGEKALPPPLSGELAELGQALETMREKLEGRHYVERYVHTLTHEMKSPLAAIHGAVELLGEDLPEVDRQRFLGNIREQDERLQRLVERMLGLATLESRQGLENPKQVSLVEVLDTVCRSKAPQLAKAELQLKCALPPEARVLGEAFLLEQALSNLLDNAMEFSPKGGLITISLAPSGTGYLLTMQDQGPGIPDFALDRVFEAFYSLPRPATGKKSTGLGLCFVREVAELHDGAADLRNAPGGGVEARLALHTHFT